MDQTGVYALEEALGRLSVAGVRVLLVGVPVSHVDLLEELKVIPAVIPRSDVFLDFEGLMKALPGIIRALQSTNAADAPR
jgi:hypothetical protein